MTQTHFRRTVVRASKPSWSFAPTSGEGAAKHGGRFNPKGVPALYTSFEFETCAHEVRFSLNVDPYTFYYLSVESSNLVDLSARLTREAHGISWLDLECPNWESEMHRGETPSSHDVAMKLIDKGFHGIIVPSFAQHASPDNLNLVLWNWKLKSERTEPDESCAWVEVLRPHLLPQNRSSWKA
ncbi:MAG: RES family NAD+ phosphorylase [Pseudomonadota bacterium]